MNTLEDVFKQIMYQRLLGWHQFLFYMLSGKLLGFVKKCLEQVPKIFFPNGGFYGDESHGRTLNFMVMNPMVESVKNHQKTHIQD